MNDGMEPARRTPWWQWLLLGVLVIAVLRFGLGSLGGGSSSCGSGLLSSDSNTSNPAYSVPKDQFKGVSVEMSVHRCSGDSEAVGDAKPYVQVLVKVHGSTSDKSTVRGFHKSIYVYSRSHGGGWTHVKLWDTPTDTGEISGDNLVNNTDWRWRLGHVATKVVVKLKLTTDKGEAAIVRHTFNLP
jgi:hypothetical protein